jgi:hypothetical protein
MDTNFNAVPSDRELVAILAIAISQHPHVLNTLVFAPERPAEPIKIEKIKLYGGRELTEAGLVLGVYPDKVSLGSGMSGYARETPLSISSNQVEGATFLLEAHYVAQLSYRVPDFDQPIKLTYNQLLTAPPAGVGPTEQLYFNQDSFGYNSAANFQPGQTFRQLDVVVLPAEEVLRDWTTILRYVIRDIRYLHPYRIRSPQITAVVYDTSTIFEKSNRENLVFHTASIHFKFLYTEGNFDR